MSKDNWYRLDLVLPSTIVMWMIPMMVAAFVFTPELWTGMQDSSLQAQQNLQGFSPDFLLTRAVDRPVVFHARAALFWILVLLPAIILLGLAAWKPSISIEAPLNPPGAGTVYLEALPGASVTKTTKSTETITSPTGRLAIAGVMVLLSAVCATFWQVFFFAIISLKFKRWIFYTVVIGMIASPFLMIGSGHGQSLENLILLILRHPIAAAGIVGIFVAAAWAFSAARAKRIEYP